MLPKRIEESIKTARDYPKYPPKGEQYKCEGCGLVTKGWFKQFLLVITGRMKTYKTTPRWHYLHSGEWKYHPQYSKEPYYWREYDRFTGAIFPVESRFLWLCHNCFETAKKKEEQLEREVKRAAEEEERRWDKEFVKGYWENPRIGLLKGPQLEVMKWFKKHEGRKVRIRYDNSEGAEYCKNVEWIIECPEYWGDEFRFPANLSLPNGNITNIRIEESQIHIHLEYGPRINNPAYFEIDWTIKLI